MSDWLALAVVAGALYLVECLAWVRPTAVCCFVSVGRGWWCRRGSSLPGNERGGLALVDPLTFDGGVVLCAPWPVSLSPDGVANVRPTDAGGVSAPVFVPFEAVGSVEARDADILFGGKLFARAPGPRQANELVAMIHRLARHPADHRPSALAREVAACFDEAAAAETWRAFRSLTRVTGACSFGLFASLFLVAPAVLVVLGPHPSWQYLLAGVFALTITTAVSYFRAHRRLHPASAFDRWTQTIAMVLFPLAAVRAVDRLSRDALWRFDLTTAAFTVGGAAAIPQVRVHVIDMDGSGSDFGIEEPEVLDCVRWFRALLASETRASLERLGMSVLEPPAREGAELFCYCPRCHAQFTKEATRCPDCPGVVLKGFDVTASQMAAHPTP